MNCNIEEDGQSCIQEVYGDFGPNTTYAVEKYLITHKWWDGQTCNGTQILDRDITHWALINDDSYLEDNILLTPIIREDEFL